jgi:hypothetical protein
MLCDPLSPVIEGYLFWLGTVLLNANGGGGSSTWNCCCLRWLKLDGALRPSRAVPMGRGTATDARLTAQSV